ncbi:MAG TPA: VWA domain-containing protein [Chloroflexia bacterium]|nr:VWA domain-containing protein [Chloroflexia bacterium]
MTFIWPVMLAALMLLPLFVVAYLRMQRRRRRLVEQYGTGGGVQQAANRRLRTRRHLPALLFLLALAILVISLARPETLVSLPRLEGQIVLAFDVSASMAGDDVKPTRLEAAKAAARDFVERQPSGVQIGIVTFSDGGFAAQPPTSDQDAILAAINRLTVQRGTSLAHGIEASLKTIAAGTNPVLSLSNRTATPTPTPRPVPKGSYTSAAIILLTDGENNQSPDPLELAQTAADRGIRIYTVGVGSADGATLHLDGFTVRSRLDETTLRQIADLTGGTYQSADNAADLHTIYDTLNPQLVVKPQTTEITAIFAGAGILVLLLGATLSFLWLGRLL